MNIPGYYYDPEKRRYFKVENSKTAPANAAWSSSNVKRRKLYDEEAAAAQRHLSLARGRIRRAGVLHEPLTGGFFAREHGRMNRDMQAACFVDGLRDKGRIPLLRPGVDGPGTQIRCMYIGACDRTGMCTAYAAPNEALLLSAYCPRDENRRLNQRLLANYRIPENRSPPPYVEAQIPHISDIKYHAPSNRMLMTSRQPFVGSSPNALWAFSPELDGAEEDPLRPRWLLPSAGVFANLPISRKDRRRNDYEAHYIAPAPASSPLVCIVGTSRGLVQWDRSSELPVWLTPPALLQPDLKHRSQEQLFRDVFAVDFHPSQRDVVRFGGRPGALFTADTRAHSATWSHLKLPSPITHLRCLDGGNQVLVAGLRKQLGVYDLRFVRSRRGASDDGGRVDVGAGDEDRGRNDLDYHPPYSRRDFRNGGGRRGKWRGANTRKETRGLGDQILQQPVVRFERYGNTAHIDIGFAYDAATGVVATAHDDAPGTIVLYSVHTGSRLRVLNYAAGERAADPPVIQSLQFRIFPGDHTPTLFVGGDRRRGIAAFSFGVDDLKDEA